MCIRDSITIDTVEGMQFDKGYVSAYFVTDNDRMEAVMKDPYILITDQKKMCIRDRFVSACGARGG